MSARERPDRIQDIGISDSLFFQFFITGQFIGIPKTTGEKAGSPVIYRAVSPLSFQMFYGIDFFRIVRFYICMSQLAYQEPVIMKSPRGTRHHNSVLQSRRRLFQLIRRNI